MSQKQLDLFDNIGPPYEYACPGTQKAIYKGVCCSACHGIKGFQNIGDKVPEIGHLVNDEFFCCTYAVMLNLIPFEDRFKTIDRLTGEPRS